MPVHFSVEFIDEDCDQLWVHQLVLESIQDGGFDDVSPYRQQIVTRALVPGGGASVVGLADLGETAAARPVLG